jgi:predicted dehydrogenase
MNKNVLIIGSGSIAKKHIINLKKLNYSVYISTSNKNFIKKKNDLINIKNLKSYPTFEFAIIANNTNDHFKSIDYLIKKKIHIYCEKPISNKMFNYKKIRILLKKNKIIYHSGYQLLNDSKVLFLKKKLKKLKIKSFIASVGHDFTKWRDDKLRNNSYYSNTSMGGGVIFDLVHEVNLIRFFFGNIANIKTFKKKSDLFNCEDIAVSIIKTKKNIIGTLYQDMYSRFLFRSIQIITNKKNYKIDFVKNCIFENDKIIEFRNSNKQISLLKKNLIVFIKKIKKRDYSLSNFDESIDDLKNCLKMHKTV